MRPTTQVEVRVGSIFGRNSCANGKIPPNVVRKPAQNVILWRLTWKRPSGREETEGGNRRIESRSKLEKEPLKRPASAVKPRQAQVRTQHPCLSFSAIVGALCLAACGTDGLVDVGTDAGPGMDASADGGMDAATDGGSSAMRIVAIATGDATNVALSNTGDLYIWGDNFDGRYVDGDSDLLSPVLLPGFSDVKDISVGDVHLCVLTNAGTVSCVGRNSNGQLGDNTELPSTTPKLVPLNDVESVYAGDGRTCAIVGVMRQLYCWGDNRSDQLGLGPDAESELLTPTEVPGMTQVAEVVGGEDVTCVRLLNGTARCVGDGRGGEVGHGMEERTDVFTDVATFTNFESIASGDDFSCGIVGGGQVVCWGSGSNALSLGQPTITRVSSPEAVADFDNARKVSSSFASNHTCAVTEQDTVSCFGGNDQGQLGRGTVTEEIRFSGIHTPLDVAGLPAMTDVAVGGTHTCALDENGAVWCWGINSNGELGVGTEAFRETTPQRVMF